MAVQTAVPKADEAVDILHPLATLHWKQGPNLPEDITDAQCVFLHDKLYVGSGFTSPGQFNTQLFVFSSNLVFLFKLTTPTTQFALTTYDSQLVLVGGKLSSTNKLSNQLWRNEGKDIWNPSLLPPMPTARSSSSAVNTDTGSIECIVVAGGHGETGPLDVVEVLIQGQWSRLQPLPEPCWNMLSTLHKGKWYLNSLKGYMFCCNLESLLKGYGESSDVWSETDDNVLGFGIASFGQQLITIGSRWLASTSSIHALSPFTQSWVHVGDMPEEPLGPSAIVLALPTRELFMIGKWGEGRGCSMLKASLTMSPYDPDSHFNMKALSRLEETGIKIVTSLYDLHAKLVDNFGVDKLWSVRKVISKWVSGRISHHTPTWRTLLDILRKFDLVELSRQIEDYLSDNLNYLDAYQRILTTRDSLEILFVKMIFIGPPRLGKTTARRRLAGEIADINSAAEPEQPSTGAVESGENVVVRNISSTTAVMTPSEWSVLKDLTEEARVLLQFIYNHNMEQSQPHVSSNEGSSNETHTEVSSEKDEKIYSSGEEGKMNSDKVVREISNAQITSDKDSTSLKEQGSSDKPHGSTQEINTKASSRKNEIVHSNKDEKTHSDKSIETVLHPQNSSEEDSSLKEQGDWDKHLIPKLFHKAVDPKLWKDIKRLFKDSALLKMEDTGGQPEFMDMLPALTIGPALYLLFCKLIDNLFRRYTVSYLSPTSRESTTPVESSYTMEEVLLTALASVSCFSSYSAFSETSVEEGHSSEVREILNSSFKSVAYIVGTHKDLASEERIDEFDQQLQHSIRSTDFFREDLVQFFSDKRMILAIDNMKGGAKEIEEVRKFLERGIHQHFKKLRIPASWLVISLCLRSRTERIASLDDCQLLARQLDMPSNETKIALWFLHHYFGVLMYFPDLPELENTVICDTQIIYDSVTSLIIDTFKLGSVSKWASETFRETGQFSLEDIRGATSKVSGDYIPLNQLVKLLEHLNIIAPIVKDNSNPSQTNTIQSSKVTYFMPCVLQNASSEELTIYSSCNPYLPASLMIRFKCGFVPLGIFPAIIAHLVSHSPLKLIEHDIKKNCVQFRYGTDYDTVTLIYRTKYFEIHIKREHTNVTPTHEMCRAVRDIIMSTLNAVSSCMNYTFSLRYQLSFECPTHPGEDHLCVVDSKEIIPHKMNCLKNAKNPQPVDMQSQHLVWFGKALTCSEGYTSGSNLQPEGALDYQAYTSSLSPCVHPLLEQQLDWDHGGVDVDLNEIADHMLDWEERLSAHLGLTRIAISDIKKIYLHQPPLQRREALKRWRNRCGLCATYGNLLKLCVEAGHTECAQVICDMLNRKVEPHAGVSRVAPSSNVSTVGGSTAHSIDCTSLKSPPTESYTTPPASRGLSRTRDASSPDSDAPKPKLRKLSPAADSADVREFSEDLSSGDLYRYLFKHVPRRDCDIIKDEGISGLCFLELSKEEWKDYGLSRAGVIAVAKLQEKIKAAQN